MRALYKHKFLTIVSLLIIIIITSCKQQDDLAPVISILQPTSGSFLVFDTIRVQADVTDNESIQSIRIRLIDMDNQQVVPSYSYTVNVSSYQLKADFVIDNLYLESGSYYLVVEASDGINTSKKYVSVLIGALPRYLEDQLIVERDNQQTHIYSIKNGKVLFKTFPFAYQDFIYNPYSKQYLFLSEGGVLTAYDKDDIEILWQVTDLKDPLRAYYGSLFYKDNVVYVNNYSGGIKAYDGNGNLLKQANTIDSYGQISQYFFGYDKIMVFKEPYVFGNDKIEQLNEVSGASVWTYDIQFSPKQLLFVDEDLCLVFGNEYNIAKACSLSTLYNVIHPFGDFGSRKLGDAYKYSKYYYILSLDQEILEYDLSNGNERVLETTQTNVQFYYEDLYEKLYFIDENKISNLHFPATGSQVFYQNNNTIDDLIFVYNK